MINIKLLMARIRLNYLARKAIKQGKPLNSPELIKATKYIDKVCVEMNKHILESASKAKDS